MKDQNLMVLNIFGNLSQGFAMMGWYSSQASDAARSLDFTDLNLVDFLAQALPF